MNVYDPYEMTVDDETKDLSWLATKIEGPEDFAQGKFERGELLEESGPLGWG